MSAAEFAFWGAFERRYGFPVDRLEAGTAIAGMAVSRTLGAKVGVADLIPKFQAASGAGEIERLRSYLSGLKSATYRRVGKNGEVLKEEKPKPDDMRRRLRGR